MYECILGVLDERAMRSARLFPSVFLFHLPILYNRPLYLQSKLPRKRLLLLKKRQFQQRKVRENSRSFANTSSFSLLFRAQMIFHTVRFHLSILRLCRCIFPAKVICLRHNAQFAGNACIHIRSSSSYVIVDYTFPLINIACALCVNEDDGAFRGAAAFPLKIRSRPALVHLHCALCIRRPVRCVPSFVHSIAASSNAPLARTRFASRFAAASRCNAPPSRASPPCGACRDPLDPRPASCHRQQPVSATAAAAASMR